MLRVGRGINFRIGEHNREQLLVTVAFAWQPNTLFVTCSSHSESRALKICEAATTRLHLQVAHSI